MNSFRVLLLMLLLCFFNFSNAQQNAQNTEAATIVLKDGAKLYSTDNTFNQQVVTEKVILKNSELSYNVAGSKNSLLSATAKKDKEEKKDFKNQVKNAEAKKQKDALKKVKKEIQEYENKKGAFNNIDFKGFPASNQFFSSNSVAKIYVAPSLHYHDFSSSLIAVDANLVKRALDFLHSQKYTYYNNKSLDFCFSEVFSVRPPPVLV